MVPREEGFGFLDIVSAKGVEQPVNEYKLGSGKLICTLDFQVEICCDLHPENAPPPCGKLVHFMHLHQPLEHLNYFYTYTLNLRDLILLAQDLEEPGALLGVGDFLKLTDLYFPILLDESDEGNGIVFDHGTIRRGEQGCIL